MTPERAEVDPVVFVIDDDTSLRETLLSLFRSVGLQAEGFASPAEFLRRPQSDIRGCMVLDVRLPGLSGLEFQSDLAKSNVRIPIIFMTGHGDIPMSVRAMKAGAVEFLTKPFREQDMLDAVQLAFERDRGRVEAEEQSSEIRTNFASLSRANRRSWDWLRPD